MSEYLIAGDVYREISREVWRTGTFTITEDHLTLLRRAYVRWDDSEFGAPTIDAKRPYGNSSVERDIAEIVNEPAWQEAVAEDERHDDEAAQDYYLSRNRNRLVRLHAETGIALQIALSTGQIVAGEYRRGGPSDAAWARVDTVDVPL